MKKLLILTLCVGITLPACKKKESESPTYTKSQFLGKWKQTIPDTGDEMVYLNFTETQLEQTDGPEGDEMTLTYDYTFDGRVIRYKFFVDVYLTINELTATKLVLTQTAAGYSGSERFTYTKVE
jgi:hypothetical protein